jgi:hypothetical protein
MSLSGLRIDAALPQTARLRCTTERVHREARERMAEEAHARLALKDTPIAYGCVGAHRQAGIAGHRCKLAVAATSCCTSDRQGHEGVE